MIQDKSQITLELTNKEIRILSWVDKDLSEAVSKMIREYKNKVNSTRDIQTLISFLTNELETTGNRKDIISLKELYYSYYDYCLNLKEKPYPKSAFRRFTQDRDFEYGLVSGNINVFKGVRFKTNEDKEWEL